MTFVPSSTCYLKMILLYAYVFFLCFLPFKWFLSMCISVINLRYSPSKFAEDSTAFLWHEFCFDESRKNAPDSAGPSRCQKAYNSILRHSCLDMVVEEWITATVTALLCRKKHSTPTTGLYSSPYSIFNKNKTICVNHKYGHF